MMQPQELKEDTLMTCPYNKSHQILSSRMQFHLVKCKKQHSTVDEKLICPFDATHHLSKSEYHNHLEICPNRKVIESHLYQVGSSTDETIDLHQTVTIPARNESWDDENAETYDPLKETETRPVMRALEGGTKSERKAFRSGERHRVEELRRKKLMEIEKRKNQKVLNVDIPYEGKIESSQASGGKRLRPPSQSSLNQALQRSQEIALSHHNAIDKAKANVSSRLENSFSKLKEETE